MGMDAISAAIAATAKCERAACAAYASAQCVSVRAIAARGGISEEEADLLCQRIEAFAGGIRAGLHIGETNNG